MKKLTPTGMQWTGGKGANSVPQGPWVASLLPQTTECCYVEPFAGMLGVLLQRPASKSEIANDTDHLLINWWKVVRDHPNELIRALELTPHSRYLYNEAVETLKECQIHDRVERARLWTITVDQSISKTMGKSGFSQSYSIARGRGGQKVGYWEKKLTALAYRIRQVQLDCQPAEKLLERLAKEKDTVIYCDPPYPSATEFYGNAELDVELIAELLTDQQGRVAVSGYGDEWDLLGWEKHECRGTSCGSPSNKPSEAQVRREILWTNYPATTQGKLI